MRTRQKMEMLCAVAAVFAFEMLVTAFVTGAVGLFLIPFAFRQRGYWAVGGEWLLLMVVAMAAYSAVHHAIFKSGKRCRRDRRGKRDGEHLSRSSRAGDYMRSA